MSTHTMSSFGLIYGPRSAVGEFWFRAFMWNLGAAGAENNYITQSLIPSIHHNQLPQIVEALILLMPLEKKNGITKS